MSFSAIRSSLQFSKILSCNKALFVNSMPKTLSMGQKSTRTITRSLYFLCRNRGSTSFGTFSRKLQSSNTCSCGCSVHTQKGDEELAAFLSDEIENEKKSYSSDIQTLGGFECSLNGAEMIFTKRLNNEIITIKSNVNNSVDADDSVMENPDEPKGQQESVMRATPDFTVEIKKGRKILSFLCTYTQSSPEEEPNTESYNDAFEISELSIYEEEIDDSTYTVSGDIMDGYLYDLLMNYLEERGISNDFAEKLTEVFTAYEHKLYIQLLQGLKSFVEK